MPVAERAFRSPASHAAETVTRAMLVDFLEQHEFRAVTDKRRAFGRTESQTVVAENRSGEKLVMRVRLCWRRERGNPTDDKRSAAQLMARIDAGDWERSMSRKIERQRSEGATHLLLVQRIGDAISDAALIPLDEVLPAWCAQRDASSQLIARGALGRRRKNHAMNGASPTLWLRDDDAPEVAAALRDRPRVVILGANGSKRRVEHEIDDTLDDLPGLDPALLGIDGASSYIVQRSHIRRNPRVRAAVRDRANGICERPDCGASRSFAAFLDVHHILGIATSDRIANCVAICPNCHREAHFSAERAALNELLLHVAAGH